MSAPAVAKTGTPVKDLLLGLLGGVLYAVFSLVVHPAGKHGIASRSEC